MLSPRAAIDAADACYASFYAAADLRCWRKGAARRVAARFRHMLTPAQHMLPFALRQPDFAMNDAITGSCYAAIYFAT